MLNTEIFDIESRFVYRFEMNALTLSWLWKLKSTAFFPTFEFVLVFRNLVDSMFSDTIVFSASVFHFLKYNLLSKKQSTVYFQVFLFFKLSVIVNLVCFQFINHVLKSIQFEILLNTWNFSFMSTDRCA